MAPIGLVDVNCSVKSDVKCGNNCKLCYRKVRKGIQCKFCKWWFHENCCKINIKLITVDHSWSCDACVIKTCEKKFLNIIQDKDAKIRVLQNDIESLQMKYAALERSCKILGNINTSMVDENNSFVTSNSHEMKTDAGSEETEKENSGQNSNTRVNKDQRPTHIQKETFGVIADPATTMRDPILYRWHAFVDGIFQEHKKVIPRYTVQQLSFDKVRVTGVEVITEKAPKNEFSTFWQQNDIDLSRGLDFAPRGPIFVRFTHLQHTPFVTKIQVENGGTPRTGTVRIFMAPKYDERGLPMLLRDQRLLFIEMDKFSVQLKSGSNIIQRRSDESSVTIPFERTFRNLTGVGEAPQAAEYTYCGCGWPQHMLIPKGRQEGLPAEFFVMVSDGSVDKVEQPAPQQSCHAAHSYCGLHNRRYPDRRSMGYPFDRVPRDGVNTLREFMTPNMGLIDVQIRHSEVTVGPGP